MTMTMTMAMAMAMAIALVGAGGTGGASVRRTLRRTDGHRVMLLEEVHPRPHGRGKAARLGREYRGATVDGEGELTLAHVHHDGDRCLVRFTLQVTLYASPVTKNAPQYGLKPQLQPPRLSRRSWLGSASVTPMQIAPP